MYLCVGASVSGWVVSRIIASDNLKLMSRDDGRLVGLVCGLEVHLVCLFSESSRIPIRFARAHSHIHHGHHVLSLRLVGNRSFYIAWGDLLLFGSLKVYTFKCASTGQFAYFRQSANS